MILSIAFTALDPELCFPRLPCKISAWSSSMGRIRGAVRSPGLCPDATQVRVNYTDRWIGIWPPFVFYNPGMLRERRISRLIFAGE